MTQTLSDYTPPEIWAWDQSNGGQFANINRPVSGATHDAPLKVGKHPLQLYSLGTPNGVKVTIMLEELLALGHSGAEYDAWLISIREGDQFGSGFVDANPNSKIPALIDHSTDKLYLQSPPNNGTLTEVGALGIDVTNMNGFDIGSTRQKAYLIATVSGATKVYTVNTTTGAATAGPAFPSAVSGFSIGLGF